MLTPEELMKLKINKRAAREAFDLSQKRLADTLTTKAGWDQKATILLSVLVSVAVAVVGVAAVLLRDPILRDIAWAFFAAGAIFSAAAFVAAYSMRGMEYGNLGTAPAAWLRAGVIDGGDDELARMFAYMAHATDRLIDMNQAANASKSRTIVLCMVLAALGALFFACAAWAASRAIL